MVSKFYVHGKIGLYKMRVKNYKLSEKLRKFIYDELAKRCTKDYYNLAKDMTLYFDAKAWNKNIKKEIKQWKLSCERFDIKQFKGVRPSSIHNTIRVGLRIGIEIKLVKNSWKDWFIQDE